MKDGSFAFDRVVRLRLVEKLEAIVMTICRLQQHPAPDRRTQAAIVTAELTRLATAGNTHGHELDVETFDRLAKAIKAWRLSDLQER